MGFTQTTNFNTHASPERSRLDSEQTRSNENTLREAAQ